MSLTLRRRILSPGTDAALKLMLEKRRQQQVLGVFRPNTFAGDALWTLMIQSRRMARKRIQGASHHLARLLRCGSDAGHVDRFGLGIQRSKDLHFLPLKLLRLVLIIQYIHGLVDGVFQDVLSSRLGDLAA